MNPYVDFEPLRTSAFIEIAIVYWPAFLTLAAVIVIRGRSEWLLWHRPLRRLETLDYRASLWPLPVLVWAFLTSLVLGNGARSAFLYSLGVFGLFTHEFLLQAFLTLCLLVALQLLAVLVVERGRLGLGTSGHFRVSMIYALMGVVLDGFLLLCVLIGRWRA